MTKLEEAVEGLIKCVAYWDEATSKNYKLSVVANAEQALSSAYQRYLQAKDPSKSD